MVNIVRERGYADDEGFDAQNRRGVSRGVLRFEGGHIVMGDQYWEDKTAVMASKPR